MADGNDLHGSFRSSAACRVRIALNTKGVEVEHRIVHLELHPDTPLLPGFAKHRAINRKMALTIATDIHPSGHLRALDKSMSDVLGPDKATRAVRCHISTESGFEVIGRRVANPPVRLCHGGTPSPADVSRAPEMFRTRRFGMDPRRFPLAVRTDAALAGPRASTGRNRRSSPLPKRQAAG